MTQDLKNNEVQQEAAEKQFFLIDVELMQAIANFLGDQKFKEVAGLIKGLESSRPVKLKDESDPTPVARGSVPMEKEAKKNK